jgi:hypothetical protein
LKQILAKNEYPDHIINKEIDKFIENRTTTNTTSATSYSRKAEEIHRSSIQQQQGGRFC